MKYYQIVILSIIIIGLLSCSEKVNYNNHELDIIGEKVCGIWVDEEYLNDTVLIFLEINENKTELSGAMSNEFEITETGFKTALNDITIKIKKERGFTSFSMYSMNLIESPKSYKIEYIDDNILRLNNYKEFRKVKKVKYYKRPPTNK